MTEAFYLVLENRHIPILACRVPWSRLPDEDSNHFKYKRNDVTPLTKLRNLLMLEGLTGPKIDYVRLD